MRVSVLHQYFFILFRDQPAELWDCRTLTHLKTVPPPPAFPTPADIAWSAHGLRKFLASSVDPAAVSIVHVHTCVCVCVCVPVTSLLDDVEVEGVMEMKRPM